MSSDTDALAEALDEIEVDPDTLPTEHEDGPDESADASDEATPTTDAADPTPRDEQGRFAKRSDEQADTATTDDAPPDAPASAEASPAVATEGQPPAPPVWEPFAVTANGQAIAPIPDAQVTRADGRVFLAVPEAHYARTQQILSRGVHAEREIPRLMGENKSLREQLTAPRAPTENEVVAEVALEMIAKWMQGDPDVIRLAENGDLFWQAMHVRAQRAYLDRTRGFEQQARESARQRETSERDTAAAQWARTEGLLQFTKSLVQEYPDLAVLSEAEVADVYERILAPVAEALVAKDDDGDYAAREAPILNALRTKAEAKADRQKVAAAATAATRFNQAQSSAPRTNTRPAPARRPAAAAAAPAAKPTVSPSARFSRAVDDAFRDDDE